MTAIRYTFRICCFAVIAAGAAGQTAAEPNDLLEQSRALRRQFIISKALPTDETAPQSQDASLRHLIEQVMSLQTPTNADSNSTPSSAADGEPGSPAAATQKTEHTAAGMPADAASDTAPRKTAVEILRRADDGRAILNPAEVADALYRAGRTDEAGRYYEMALSAVTDENAAERQWLLFQAANCLRHTDVARAAALYEELIRRYPNSAWTAAALARHNILVWMDTRREELQTRIARQDSDAQ